MKEKINYSKMLEEKLSTLCGCDERPRLLLHACCAPCSSYVLEYLCAFFDITLLYYNPNISPKSEYEARATELVRLADAMKKEKIKGAECIKTVILPYSAEDFEAVATERKDDVEGGEACFKCYKLRLEATARTAKECGFDYFCTTLSISPHKNAEVLNGIGKDTSEKYGVPYLYSDFKKKNGYKRSCELSAHYGLYRQDYCGCAYSKAEALKRAENEEINTTLGKKDKMEKKAEEEEISGK